MMAQPVHYDQNLYRFQVVDYAVFGSMLLLSAVTGLYFGCKSKIFKKTTEQTLDEYLVGGRTMAPLPVAMSLIASYVSGVTMLGTPTDIYSFGSQYMLIVVAIFCSGLVITFVYLPVFCKLRVNSSYEYLEMRFNRVVRTMASSFFVLDEFMFLPIIIYVPSLAFNQVTGINIYVIGTIVTLICIFYTFLGGLKAVVWTDTWQIIAMFISTLVVIILGTKAAGGVSQVFDTFIKGDRLILFDFNTSMYQRYTFFSVVIGGFTYWTSFNAVNQTMVQRYMALPNLKQARISLLLFTFGVSLFVWICTYAGTLVYSKYETCDPLSSGRISSEDQLLPLYVMETVGKLRGIPGLFIAGVFGAALSSLSVVLNSTAQVILEDIIKGCFRFKPTEKRGKFIVKTIVLALGGVALGFLFVIEHMGGVLQMATSFTSIAAGTSFGVFSLGMLVPWANNKGAISGALSGLLMSGTITYGSQYAGATNLVMAHKLPVSVDGCYSTYGLNVTYVEPVYPDETNIFPLFRLSYLWITPIGVITVLTVGAIVSLITGKNDVTKMDPDLISPVVHWSLPKKAFENVGNAKELFYNRYKSNDNMVLRNLE
ncbi:unnamed protein product [Brassicogethes aeneus]|uniref:Sodium-coupled monocarboxylate transporter 1 n=1 Tax=Brassicogethes aeneus TaxID=1431903 RepID=A0A9P0B878_BRAAE|nr:unnamed protein product [Brassicogethes aeneus]